MRVLAGSTVGRCGHLREDLYVWTGGKLLPIAAEGAGAKHIEEVLEMCSSDEIYRLDVFEIDEEAVLVHLSEVAEIAEEGGDETGRDVVEASICFDGRSRKCEEEIVEYVRGRVNPKELHVRYVESFEASESDFAGVAI